MLVEVITFFPLLYAIFQCSIQQNRKLSHFTGVGGCLRDTNEPRRNGDVKFAHFILLVVVYFCGYNLLCIFLMWFCHLFPLTKDAHCFPRWSVRWQTLARYKSSKRSVHTYMKTQKIDLQKTNGFSRAWDYTLYCEHIKKRHARQRYTNQKEQTERNLGSKTRIFWATVKCYK